MRHYKNLRTGVVIDVESELHGEDWQELVAPAKTEIAPAQIKADAEGTTTEDASDESDEMAVEEPPGESDEAAAAENPETEKEESARKQPAKTTKTTPKKTTTKKAAAKRPVARNRK